MLMGSSSMFVVAVVLPSVQAEFGVSRADVSLPYTLLMIGFGVGGIYMGKLVDRLGVTAALWLGSVGILIGFVWAGLSTSIYSFAIAHGLFLGLFGISATFAPLVADTSLWWNKRRGIAVAVCASGNYLAGAVWPGFANWGISAAGWRETYIVMGIVCSASLAVLAFFLRQRPPVAEQEASGSSNTATLNPPTPFPRTRPFGLSTRQAQTLLIIAGIACCVAMSMPQVHIVAYCVDLGYGPARGAEMLALMLGFGVVSRLVSGVICDKIGGVRTLILGSALQGIALLLFLPFDGLVSLYIISAIFGLFQGGIVPSYAIIVREHFPIAETGRRVGAVIMATMLGMALGGWMSGKIFDLTGSYQAALYNGTLWNALNLVIAGWLLWRLKRRPSTGLPAHVGPA
ncbi:MFS transporter [Orrella daihaiensis]|uniref:MFS transporter n=2 Tax=Orrella daihaiensis TaxID=2782176 RepID=A0ABY4AR70_9BURK|nr:MFS transporter [Orrella daihaiensis]